MGALFQTLGSLLALANGIWLTAHLLAPHGMSRIDATLVFLPIGLIGVVFVWTGKRLARRELERTTEKKAANQPSERTR